MVGAPVDGLGVADVVGPFVGAAGTGAAVPGGVGPNGDTGCVVGAGLGLGLALGAVVGAAVVLGAGVAGGADGIGVAGGALVGVAVGVGVFVLRRRVVVGAGVAGLQAHAKLELNVLEEAGLGPDAGLSRAYVGYGR